MMCIKIIINIDEVIEGECIMRIVWMNYELKCKGIYLFFLEIVIKWLLYLI